MNRMKKNKRLPKIKKNWILNKSKYFRLFFEDRRVATLAKYDQQTLELKRKNLIQSNDISDIVTLTFYFHNLG